MKIARWFGIGVATVLIVGGFTLSAVRSSESMQFSSTRSLKVDEYKNVSFISSTGTPDEMSASLRSAISTRIELRLRSAGLRPTKSLGISADGILEVQTDLMSGSEHVFKACLKFERNVSWSNSIGKEQFHAVVPVWEQCVMGIVGTSRDIELIPEAISGSMDTFLNEYLKANQN